MKDPSYLIIFREHLLDPFGVNSGAEMATLYLARGLVRAGKRVILCAHLPQGECSFEGVECWDLGPGYDVSSVLARASEQGRYHLISAGRALPILLSRLDSRCCSRALITHDRTSGDSGVIPSVLERNVDTIFCVSHAQRELFVRDGVDPSKLVVLHNGVDLDRFKAGAPEARDPRKLMFVGALIVDKGIHILIESFAKLKQRYSDLTLDVYGSASLWGRQDFINQREIAEKVPGITFHGKVAQEVIARAYQTAGACVIPSIWFDPFPLVSIDAQACGCPVIAFDVGGLREGIEHGVTGIVIPEVGEAALTRALDSALGDRSYLIKMSKHCLEQARGRFTWEQVVEKVCSRAEASQDEITFASSRPPKIGFVTTWNQSCGLATYASYLVSQFPADSYCILSEQLSSPPTRQDEPYVTRCWSRESGEYSALERAALQNQVEVLYINGHYRFFHPPAFGQFLERLRSKGVRSIVHLHSTFTLDEKLKAIAQSADRVVVHSQESRLEVIANGADPERVLVVPHGVYISPYRDMPRQDLRAQLDLSSQEFLVSCFGFVQPHKGIEGLIEGVAHLRTRGVPVRGLVLGSVPPEDPNGNAYREALGRLAKERGVSDVITFADRFLEDDEVVRYLSASDVVLLNYRSQHYEASGAGSLAVGSGALVLTSIAPSFQPFGDAVWHLSAGYPIPLAFELAITNSRLKESILAHAREYSSRYSWERIAATAQKIIANLSDSTDRDRSVEEPRMTKDKGGALHTPRGGKSSALRVLMQNRGNCFTQRGGDTVVMERTKLGLEARGVQVVIDVEGREDPAQFDVVHLFNFALPDLVRHYGERAIAAGTPFVVTTLYEDIPRFHNQSVTVGRSLVEYVARGQDRLWYEQHRVRIDEIKGCPHFENSWAARHAAALIVNGEREADTLRRDFSDIQRIEVVPVGYDLSEAGNGALFMREFGVRDFIFCVGRLETRKNQLMLLKALEEIELPLVFASGGFSYQPDYNAAVRAFRRRAKTLVLDKLSPQMLASAYAAARVHVLPSWYELPGLVSLEAAHHGCNVVVTEMGTAPDYFGSEAFYCNPSNEASIVHATLAAFYSPFKEGLKEVAMKNSWDYAAERTLQTYESVLPKTTATATVQAENVVVVDLESSATEFQDLLERGEMAAKNREFARAHELFTQAERINPRSARLLRARGAVLLAQGEVPAARASFEQGIALDPANAKLLCGLGMCAMSEHEYAQAHERFIQALSHAPSDLVAILQLIECSYILNRFDGLESVLRRYTQEHPHDLEMQYCLAGCLFKKGELSSATQIAHRVLQSRSDHLGAQQLLAAIRDAEATSNASIESAPSSGTAAGTVSTQREPIARSPEMQFDENDRRIAEIDELKRKRDYSQVRERSTQLLQQSLREDQREKLTLIQAEIKVLEGEIEEAESTYDAILSKNPDSPRALCGKGAISANRDEWNKAREYFERANSLSPDYDVAWAGLGVTSFWAKDYERAWENFNRAIAINPENIRALLGIIELGYPLKRLDAVEYALKGYLEMHPVDLEFQYALAGCYFAQDKLREASDEVNKITLFDPEHEKAVELRGMIDEKLRIPASNAR